MGKQASVYLLYQKQYTQLFCFLNDAWCKILLQINKLSILIIRKWIKILVYHQYSDEIIIRYILKQQLEKII